MSNTSTVTKIMVVDDGADIVHIVLAYLRQWKFDAQGFTSPDDAWEAFQKNPTGFSLVLTDLRMPGMSGLELAKKLLQLREEIKITLMTAFEIEIVELDSGLPIFTYQDVLKKPFRLKQVCDAVKKQLQVAR